MAISLFKEIFNGQYDGVTSPLLLPQGSIADGKNVRKVSGLGGWKARKGVSAHNTTAIASASVLSLHQFINHISEDYHFLAQCNGNIYEATNHPPASGTTFGSSLMASASTTQPGFGDSIEESFVYADGDRPWAWGGDTPRVVGFVTSDDGEEVDETVNVTDERDGTYAVLPNSHTDDCYYFCCPEPADELVLEFVSGQVNAETATATISAWRSGSWTSVGTLTDGTISGTATHAKSGTISWTKGSDEMKVIKGIMGYWYKVTWSADLTAGVEIKSAKCHYAMQKMTNKWSGVYETPLAVRFHDDSAGTYEDLSGKLSNESTSQYLQLDGMTTSDEILIKGLEPITGFGFGVADGYENTAAAKVSSISYYGSSGWTAVTTGIVDETLDSGGTKGFSQSGTIWIDGSDVSPRKVAMDFDSTPGYWYKIKVSAELDNGDNDIRVFLATVAYFPEELDIYDGVVEFKSRAFVWGDKRYPNRLRYSCRARPDCFSGSDSGWTDALGDLSKIVCAKRFYNELIVWKKNSVFLLEGESPATFGTLKIADTVGCIAPKTAHVIEIGYEGMKTTEPLSIAIWMDRDGVYALDGRKPKKISLQVDQFFNPEYGDCMSASQLSSCQAFIDKANDEYHLLIGATELVYNYKLGEWYPPWSRRVGASGDKMITGISLIGYNASYDERYYSYGATDKGRVFRLETDTSDKNENNSDVAITHYITTRAICANPQQSTTLEFTFRKVWIEAKARTSPASKDIVTTFYRDLASSGTTLASPSALNLANTGYSLVVDGLEANQVNCTAFQLKFYASTIDLELELNAITFGLESRGEIDVQ